MIITIDNQLELSAVQTLVGIFKEGQSIPATLRAIANSYTENDYIEVQIHKDIFPQISSYKTNPAQLAKVSNVGDQYYFKHGYIRRPYIVIVFSRNPPTPDFWGQCLDYCSAPGTYTFAHVEVPITYRNNASLLRYRLKEATGKKIRVQKTPTLFRLVVPRTDLT